MPPRKTEPELIGVKDAAALVSVHPATIRRWISQGVLKSYWRGRTVRLRREEVLGIFREEL